MMHQLNPAIPIITPKGKAIAHAIIDYGIEADLHWVCFQDGTGECWTWSNTQIRAQINITHGRNYISPFYNPDDTAFKKEKDEEEEDDEDNEDNEDDENGELEHLELLYNARYHEINNLEKELKEIEKKHDVINEQFENTLELLQKLYNNDHIFTSEMNNVAHFLLGIGIFKFNDSGRLILKE